jgi:NADPH:quinone reductase-like Zn-dependent oxidoreductase
MPIAQGQSRQPGAAAGLDTAGRVVAAGPGKKLGKTGQRRWRESSCPEAAAGWEKCTAMERETCGPSAGEQNCPWAC